jgi:hypothetical protein
MTTLVVGMRGSGGASEKQVPRCARDDKIWAVVMGKSPQVDKSPQVVNHQTAIVPNRHSPDHQLVTVSLILRRS